MMLAAIGLLLIPQPHSLESLPVAPAQPAATQKQRSNKISKERPDLLVLEDGKEVECRVMMEGREIVLARVGSRTKEFKRSEVKSIETIERSLVEFFEKYDAANHRDIASLAELAKFCEERSLFGEAQNLWVRVLLEDPENEQAWTKLGGVYNKRRGWRMKVRGRYYTLEELKDRKSDWKNAMFISTAHFVLKTDVDPIRALNAAFNLERAYIAYYSVLTPSVDLQNFDYIPEVHLPKDESNYPTPRFEGDNAWFSYAGNTLFVNGSKQNIASEVMFHLTPLLVDNSFRRPNRGGMGKIAPWAQRAISDALAAAVRVDGDTARWEFGQPIDAYFDYHANDEEPMTIKKLLSAGLGAYRNPPEADRYRAQAYTLLYFLANADEGKYREGLTAYLQSSVRGQSAATHLEREIGVKLKDLEAEWLEYVRKIAH